MKQLQLHSNISHLDDSTTKSKLRLWQQDNAPVLCASYLQMKNYASPKQVINIFDYGHLHKQWNKKQYCRTLWAKERLKLNFFIKLYTVPVVVDMPDLKPFEV